MVAEEMQAGHLMISLPEEENASSKAPSAVAGSKISGRLASGGNQLLSGTKTTSLLDGVDSLLNSVSHALHLQQHTSTADKQRCSRDDTAQALFGWQQQVRHLHELCRTTRPLNAIVAGLMSAGSPQHNTGVATNDEVAAPSLASGLSGDNSDVALTPVQNLLGDQQATCARHQLGLFSKQLQDFAASALAQFSVPYC